VTITPIELITKTVPALLTEARAETEGLAKQGDEAAKQRLAELASAAPLVVRVVLEGKGGKDFYVLFENGELKVQETAPATRASFAVATPYEALELTLEEMGGELEKGLARLKKRLPHVSPVRLRKFIDRLAGENMRFHYVVKDTPDFEEVRTKISIGDGTPPEKPTFTVTLEYEVIELLRERKLKPQALLGRVQLSGDSTRAMQLVMDMMQKR
jgi:putative sterol carrier protein